MINKQLNLAREYANKADFDSFLSVCQQLIDANMSDADAMISVGAALLDFGFLSAAKQCLTHAHKLSPKDLRAAAILASLAKEAGDHAEATRLHDILLKHLPNHAAIRRNILISAQYDPNLTDDERLAKAREWGDWAVLRAKGAAPKASPKPIDGRALKIGYVSADFCQHTVGLFVKEVIKAHDKTKVAVYAYSAGDVRDWVSDEISACCFFRDILSMSDEDAAKLIMDDEIDVLVDLSGHTAGSRLSLFAYRPAPVMLSWLGYFATTGLSFMDGVLLDSFHAPKGTESQFVEPIIRLPRGRFCYSPVVFAPDVSNPPRLKNGFITFGSFNNTSKYNDAVFDVWAKILSSIPSSKLILKWRAFVDKPHCERTLEAFAKRGVEPSRIELRNASFHADMLKEYADIDIALDPFPFTGGMTSCEALWMGVPVITYPQSQVVSRQTYAALSYIGLQEFAAKDADDYVKIAVELANNPKRLQTIRVNMREMMRASPLMDTAGFAEQLESVFYEVYGAAH